MHRNRLFSHAFGAFQFRILQNFHCCIVKASNDADFCCVFHENLLCAASLGLSRFMLQTFLKTPSGVQLCLHEAAWTLLLRVSLSGLRYWKACLRFAAYLRYIVKCKRIFGIIGWIFFRLPSLVYFVHLLTLYRLPSLYSEV